MTTGTPIITSFTGTHDTESVKRSGPNDIASDLAVQLKSGLVAIEAKKVDSVIRECQIAHLEISDLDVSLVANLHCHKVWQAVLDMIKAVSEGMMSTLPSFWRIAKSFLDGKFQKVGSSLLLVQAVFLIIVYSRQDRVDRVEVQRNVVPWSWISSNYTSHWYPSFSNYRRSQSWLQLGLTVKRRRSLFCLPTPTLSRQLII